MLILGFAALMWASPAAERVGFQGFTLGQTIADAKAIDLPTNEYGKDELRCSDEDTESLSLSITPAQRNAGLIRCVPGKVIGGHFGSSPIPVTPSVKTNVTLDFVDGVLVSILTEYSAADAPTIDEALRAKFGAPTDEKTGQVQNRMGASFDQKTVIWHIGDAKIELQSPWGRLNRMAVIYDTPAAGAFEQRVRQTSAAKANL